MLISSPAHERCRISQNVRRANKREVGTRRTYGNELAKT